MEKIRLTDYSFQHMSCIFRWKKKEAAKCAARGNMFVCKGPLPAYSEAAKVKHFACTHSQAGGSLHRL